MQRRFFEKINKIGKPLARLIKKKRERTQIKKIRNKKRRSHNRHHRNTKDHKRLLHATICLVEMEKFLEKYNHPKVLQNTSKVLTQDEIENINRPIISTEIETVIK